MLLGAPPGVVFGASCQRRKHFRSLVVWGTQSEGYTLGFFTELQRKCMFRIVSMQVTVWFFNTVEKYLPENKLLSY